MKFILNRTIKYIPKRDGYEKEVNVRNQECVTLYNIRKKYNTLFITFLRVIYIQLKFYIKMKLLK